jgi:hypothetical protein
MRGGPRILALAALLAWPSIARADNVPRDRAVAEALFREGRRLLDAGNVVTACEKFAESQRLDAQPGTLINLAICHETEGRIATAWAEYLEAATQAARGGQAKREQFAREHARELEGRLPMLIVEVPAQTPDLEVRLNGKPRGPSTFGVALPIDPGEVTIEASAPRKKTWSSRLTIKAGPEIKVVVPELAASEEPVEAAPPVSSPAEPSKPASKSAPLPSTPGASQRTVGYVALAVGGAGIVVGGAVGLFAIAQKSNLEADPGCPTECQNADDVKGYNRSRVVSGVSLIAGAVLVATGAVLLLTAPKSKPRGAALVLTPAGVLGTFR